MKELHLRLDGALRYLSCFDLYQRQNRDTLYRSVEELKEEMIKTEPSLPSRDFRDIPNDQTMVLQYVDAMERVTYETVIDLAKKNIDYVEIFYAPVLSTKAGFTQEEVVDALLAGISRGVAQAKGTIKVGLVLSMLRGALKEENQKTLSLYKRYKGTAVCGLSLEGNADKYPLFLYIDELREAKANNIPMSVSFEGCNVEKVDVELAIDMGVKRFSDCASLADNISLLYEVAKNNIAIECAITGEYLNKGTDMLSHNPVKAYLTYGINAFLVSDEPTIFGTDLAGEILKAKDALNLTYNDCMKLEENATKAAFLK